jgi:hypothetical protein
MGLYENPVPGGTNGRFSIKSYPGVGTGTRGIFWDGENLTIKGTITQTSEGNNVGRNMGAWSAGVQYYTLDQVTYGGYSWSSNSNHVSTNNTNAGTGYPGSGPWSLSPYAAKTIRQSASAQVFTELKNGTLTPNFIQLSAAKENITTGTTWSTSPSVTLFDAATGGNTTTSGDTVYLRTGSFAANQLIEVTSTSDGKTDKISIVRVKEGSDALTLVLTNEAHTVAAANDGTVSSYAGSGTDIYVYEGATQLDYDGVGTAAGKWTVTAVGSSVTPGALSDGGNYATMAVVSGMSANQASVTFTISGKKLNGTAFSGITKIQSLTKSIKGADGVSGATVVGAGIVFRGKWRQYESGITPRQYFGNTKRRDVVETNAVPPNPDMRYWLCKINYTTSTAADGPPATGATENTYWEPFGATFDSVATDILFADQVYADKTINIGSNGTTPIIALNADAANSNARPYISIGQGTQGFGNSGIFLGYDGTPAVGKLSVTNGLIGGWAINPATLSSPGATPRLILNPDTSTPSIKIYNASGTEKISIKTGNLTYLPGLGSTFTVYPVTSTGTSYTWTTVDPGGLEIMSNQYTAAATSIGTITAGTYQVAQTYNWNSSPGNVMSITSQTAGQFQYSFGIDILNSAGTVITSIIQGTGFNEGLIGATSATSETFGSKYNYVTTHTIPTTAEYFQRPFYSFEIVITAATNPSPAITLTNFSLTSETLYFKQKLGFTEITEEGIQVVSSEARHVIISTSDSALADALYVKGSTKLDGNSYIGTAAIAVQGGLFPSDERLKEDISDFSNGLEIIKKLNPKWFRFKDRRNDLFDAGVIAQDVQPYIPEFIGNREDGYMGVNYDAINMTMLNAIKELSNKVESMEAYISSSKI